MASFVFNRMQERFNMYARTTSPDYYVRVKYRTWRTLWLVKRTRREPRWHPIKISLVADTFGYRMELERAANLINALTDERR